MTKDDETSRAAYFREYRKENSKRLEAANSDAARKRAQRGGYKNPYMRWLRSLSEEEYAFATRFPIDSRDADGKFQPITNYIEKLKQELSRVSEAIGSNALSNLKPEIFYPTVIDTERKGQTS